MLSHFLILLWALFLWMTLWWCISLYLRRTDVVDMIWGMSYGLVALVLFLFSEKMWFHWVVLTLIIIWSTRLVLHIIERLLNHTEDHRYSAFRDTWGSSFWWKSYTFIFLLQGIFIAVISLPLLLLFFSVKISLPFFIIGIIGWIGGYVIEFFADRQMLLFRSNSANKGKIIQTGLWRYSRHPNYFGELLMWWSIWCMTIGLSSALVCILSPVLLTYLICFVTGIPLLEKSLQGREGYEEYVRTTSILIPFFRKK